MIRAEMYSPENRDVCMSFFADEIDPTLFFQKALDKGWCWEIDYGETALNYREQIWLEGACWDPEEEEDYIIWKTLDLYTTIICAFHNGASVRLDKHTFRVSRKESEGLDDVLSRIRWVIKKLPYMIFAWDIDDSGNVTLKPDRRIPVH